VPRVNETERGHDGLRFGLEEVRSLGPEPNDLMACPLRRPRRHDLLACGSQIDLHLFAAEALFFIGSRRHGRRRRRSATDSNLPDHLSNGNTQLRLLHHGHNLLHRKSLLLHSKSSFRFCRRLTFQTVQNCRGRSLSIPQQLWSQRRRISICRKGDSSKMETLFERSAWER
jgi:hypothetical protein